MAETLTTRQRAIMSKRLLSPAGQFFSFSNDDQLEQARARSAIRRKATATTALPPPDDPCLSQEQIIELIQNCIKLASENKINQKNTWELKLIDHLSEIVKVETVGDAEISFQKASCTLEAGVKIYSARVDAVHADAYKVLDGINRSGLDDELETSSAGENVENGQDGGHSMKESERKISQLSTLVPSFEALNIKKSDVAFAVDPLYHQTSARFDEGGAKGLLLNNLGVYGGCQVLFDSLEVPGKYGSYLLQNNTSDVIDISFAKEQMIMNMLVKSEISPTLKEIICHFAEDNQKSQTCSEGQKFDSNLDALDGGADTFDTNEVGLDDSSFVNYWGCDHDEETSVVNESSSLYPTFHGLHEDNDFYAAYEPPIDESFEDVTTFLFQGLGFNSKQNAWTGADYWKYRKFKGLEDVSTAESRSAFNTEKQKKKSQTEADISFIKTLDVEMLDIFAYPKNSKTLLLHVKRAPCSNTLPEYCHFQPETLVKCPSETDITPKIWNDSLSLPESITQTLQAYILYNTPVA